MPAFVRARGGGGAVAATDGAQSFFASRGILVDLHRRRARLLVVDLDRLASGGHAVRDADPLEVSLRLATRRLPSLLLLVIAMLLIVVVGLAVLIVPGVYLAVAALPAFYLLIIEGLSVRAALDGALQLVRKRWWQSAYVLLLVGIGVLVLFTIDIALNLVVTQLTGRLPSAGLSGVIGLLVSAAFQPFCIAVGFMQYRFLRQAAPPDVPVAEAG
jgi:hypothetical protein